MAKKASAKGLSTPQEIKVGPRSRPYLLVILFLDSELFSVSLHPDIESLSYWRLDESIDGRDVPGKDRILSGTYQLYCISNKRW